MVVKTGILSQFGLSTLSMHEPTLLLVPSGPGAAGSYLLASRPIEASLAPDGSFSVELIPNEQVTPETWYSMRLTWQDDFGHMEGLDLPEWRFVITNVRGPILDDAAITPHGLEVWFGVEDNPDYRFWYHPLTTELRYGMSRQLLSTLRGLPGYNATGAAEDDAAIAAFVRSLVGNTVTRQALIDSFVERGLPDGLTGKGRYDAVAGVYGIDRVPRRAMSILAEAATAHRRILCVGHSIVAGADGADTAVSWPSILRIVLGNNVPVNSGIVFAGQAVAATQGQWAFNAGWQKSTLDHTGGIYRTASAAGSTATFTSERAGTIVEFYTFPDCQVMRYRIDGGAWTDTPAADATQAVRKIAVTGLANTTHTLEIQTTAVGSYNLIGAEVRNATGLSITNMGASGTFSHNWTNSGWKTLGPMSTLLLTPHLTFIQISTNDMVAGVQPSVYAANLATIFARYKALGDVILVVDPQPNTVTAGGYAGVPAETSRAFRQVAYALADEHGVRVLDLNGYFGSFTEANAAGVMADNVHLTRKGYELAGRAADRVMAP